jgi:hypothetical protein
MSLSATTLPFQIALAIMISPKDHSHVMSYGRNFQMSARMAA